MRYKVEDVELDDPRRPFGLGVGRSTGGHFTCGMCGRVYNQPPEGADEDWVADNEDFVCAVDFGSLEVGACCFRELESAVYEWLQEAVTWSVAMAEARAARAEADLKAVADISRLLSESADT